MERKIVLHSMTNDDTLNQPLTKPLLVTEQQTETGKEGRWKKKQEVASNIHIIDFILFTLRAVKSVVMQHRAGGAT